MNELKSIDWRRTAVNVVACPKDFCQQNAGERCVVRGTDVPTATHSPRVKAAQALYPGGKGLSEDQIAYEYYDYDQNREERQEVQLGERTVVGGLKIVYRLYGHDQFFELLAKNVKWSFVEKLVDQGGHVE